MNRKIRWLTIAAIGSLIGTYALASIVIENLGVATHGSVDLTAVNIKIPSKRSRTWAESSQWLETTIDQVNTKHEKKLSFGTKELVALNSDSEKLKSPFNGQEAQL